MCGRYSNEAEFSDIRLRFEVTRAELIGPWVPTYNISPTRVGGFEQPIVVLEGNERVVRLARWWLIPSFWSKPLKALPTSFNARIEELGTKRFWSEPLRNGRCLVPATGWREFTGATGHKQPHHFHFDHQLFAFAGVSSEWQSPEGETVQSFAIITTEPSPLARVIHDRMPLVMPSEHYAEWLEPATDPQRILELAAQKAQSTPIQIYASNPIGNNSRYEGPEVLQAVGEARGVTGKLFK
jgi:putative SOS response-associated peptidase YedK